jgi:hypothetical protein
MMEGPTIHGSTKIVKEPGKRPGDESGATLGVKVRRKEVSPFSDLMVKAMATQPQEVPRARDESRREA